MFGATSASGHSLSVEAGIEVVRRSDDFACCDSAVSRSSLGTRVVLGVDLAVAQRVAVFARAGVRTGDHLIEIHMLPILVAGVAVTL